jgi:hypothetical protein
MTDEPSGLTLTPNQVTKIEVWTKPVKMQNYCDQCEIYGVHNGGYEYFLLRCDAM